MAMSDHKQNKPSGGERDKKLDEGLKETFPASDPVSETAPGGTTEPKKVDPVREGKRADDRNSELDEGLEATFPASDPVSATSPMRSGRPDRG